MTKKKIEERLREMVLETPEYTRSKFHFVVGVNVFEILELTNPQLNTRGKVYPIIKDESLTDEIIFKQFAS